MEEISDRGITDETEDIKFWINANMILRRKRTQLSSGFNASEHLNPDIGGERKENKLDWHVCNTTVSQNTGLISHIFMLKAALDETTVIEMAFNSLLESTYIGCSKHPFALSTELNRDSR